MASTLGSKSIEARETNRIQIDLHVDFECARDAICIAFARCYVRAAVHTKRASDRAGERETNKSIHLAVALHAPHRSATMAAHNPGSPRLRPGDRLFAALAPYLSFADHLSLRLVCRSWRIYCLRLGRPSPPPFPWLMLPQPVSLGPAPANARRRFYDIPAGRAYTYVVPGEAFHRCVASAHGWLVLAAVDRPRRLVLVNPITALRVVIPWPFGEKYIDRFHAVLTSSPADRACFLVVATDRLVAYCRPRGGVGWRTLRAPGFRYDAAASDVVSVGAMVYLVDARRKLWRADLTDPDPKVQRRDTAFSLPHGEERRHYLVESLGHVHLVLSDEHHKRVALFRLDWDGRMWVPVDGWRGDRVLLLGRGCSAAVPASAAAGRAPGTVLFARQPSSLIDAGVTGGHGHAWFWAESRVGARPDDLLVLKKTVPHRQGEFNAGGSFWFFPVTDPDETA